MEIFAYPKGFCGCLNAGGGGWQLFSCSLVLKSCWEGGFIRQPEEVDKCSIPSSELNQISVFSIKMAFPTCLSCSNERYQLSPQTLQLRRCASARLLKFPRVQQKNQELLKCRISRVAWERRSRQEPQCWCSSTTWPGEKTTLLPQFPHQQNNDRKIILPAEINSLCFSGRWEGVE